MLTVSLIIPLQFADTDKAIAASPTVQICRGSSDEVLSYQSVVIGKSYTDIKCVVKNGTAKTITWSGQGKNVIEVKGKGNAAEVKGINEGLEKLKVEVVTTGGETIRDDAIFSVYTLAESTMDAQTKIATKIYWGVSTDTNVRSELKKGQRLQIIGYSKAFYRVKMPNDFTFANRNDQRWGYILKKDISIPVEKISLDKTEITLKQGERTKLKANIIPSEADEKTIAWGSDAPEVVSVNDAGILTAKKSGIAEIEASVGGKKAMCKVTVSKERIGEALKLNAQKETLQIGESSRIYAVSGAVDKYTSENDNVAEVSSEGVVEAVAPGQTDIIATGANGEKVSCKVTVKYPDAPNVRMKKHKTKKNKYVITWGAIVENISGFIVYKYDSKSKKYKQYKKKAWDSDDRVVVPKGKYRVRSYKKSKNGKTYYSPMVQAKLNKQTKAKYKIIFIANGGTGKSYSQTVNFNKNRLKANQFKREGYAFVGWAKTRKGQVVQKNRSRARKLTNRDSIKLYAIWRSDKDPNGKVQRQALLYADTKDKDIGGSTKRNINQMKKVFASTSFPGEKQVNIMKYTNKTEEQMRKKIMAIGEKTTVNDVTYLFFSCHGDEDGCITLEEVGKGDDAYEEFIEPATLREWLDDYTHGKVVLLLEFCFSGTHMKKLVAGSKSNFIKKFVSAGEGKEPLKRNKKYKILTASGDGEAVGSWFGYATQYWSKGMGIDYFGDRDELYADKAGKDDEGNRCYGNGDGKITLTELYEYAKQPIYQEIVEYRKEREAEKDLLNYIKVSYPQSYPANDEFVIYQ